MNININNILYNNIIKYCEYNKINNIEEEFNRLLQIGFNVDKYGTSPFAKYEPIKEKVDVKPIINEIKIDVIKEEPQVIKSENKPTEEKPKPRKRKIQITKED